MKKIIAILAVVALIFSFAACAKAPEAEDTSNAAESASNETNSVAAGTDTYTIGICQLVQHPALDAATQGFKDALKAKLGDRVVFDEQNASGDVPTCGTIVSQFVNKNVDLIMANATPALTAAVEATSVIPILGTSITDYATALGSKNWTGKSGINVSGTADLAPLDQQAAMIKELIPTVKTVGILYCSAEANSKYQADVVAAELAKLDIETKVFTFVDTNDVTAVTQSIADAGVDCVYIPTDNTAASNTEAINNILEPAKIPVIAGEEGICKGCGIATLSISYYDLGYATGEMAYEVLVNGADPAEMEIQYTPADKLTKEYMADRAALCGITIPAEYVAIEG